MRVVLIAVLMTTAWVPGAAALDIYINNHRIAGPVEKATLTGSTVKFDAQGDVHITAPGFEVVGADAPAQSGGFPGQILLNGHQVRGVTGQALEECTVSFDAKGNLVVDAPQYKVLAAAAQGEQSKETVQPKGALKSRYFLFTETDSPGKVPFDFAVSINGKEVKTINSSLNWFTMEVTLFLKAGPNTIEIKSMRKPDKAGVAQDSFKIRIGKGRPANDTLEIQGIELEFTRLGSDVGDSVETLKLEAE